MRLLALFALPGFLLLQSCSLLAFGDPPAKGDALRTSFVTSASVAVTADGGFFGGPRDEEVDGEGWSVGWEHRYGAHFSSLFLYRSFSLDPVPGGAGPKGTASGGEIGARGYLFQEAAWNPFAGLSLLLIQDIPFAGGEDSFLLYALEVGLQWRPDPQWSLEVSWKTFDGGTLSLTDEEFDGDFLEVAGSFWF